jgi:hypothetical protein
MQNPELQVRNVAGRYGRGTLRSRNIVASVTEAARVFTVRLEDMSDPSAWLELTIEVETPQASAFVPRGLQQAG